MGQLDPGQALVVADAELAEALLAEKRLGGVHLAELLGRDAIAVLEARGQAREGGLVPVGQAERAADLPHLALPQLGLDERRPDPAGLRRLHARPVVAQVVHDGAVDDRHAAVLAGHRVEPGEELVLAEEAAVGGIGRVLGSLELLRLHDHVGKAEMRGEAAGLAQLGGGIGLGIRGGQQRAVPERVPGRAREQGGVHPAREGDHHPLHLPEEADQPRVLVREGRVDVHAPTPRGSRRPGPGAAWDGHRHAR